MRGYRCRSWCRSHFRLADDACFGNEGGDIGFDVVQEAVGPDIAVGIFEVYVLFKINVFGFGDVHALEAGEFCFCRLQCGRRFVGGNAGAQVVFEIIGIERSFLSVSRTFFQVCDAFGAHIPQALRIGMNAVVVVDVDIAVGFEDIRFAVECGAVAIKGGKSFFDDHIAGDGFQYGGVEFFAAGSFPVRY